ncbi:SYT12 protein, partial [Acromyrmex insinuator]
MRACNSRSNFAPIVELYSPNTLTSIRFTMNIKENRQLPFLDVVTKKADNTNGYIKKNINARLYKIPCSCEKVYIGEIGRTINVRMKKNRVGLVKAQHPTAQTIPGLYCQTGNASQHLLHSDSDIRLDAQGAFTRDIRLFTQNEVHSTSSPAKERPTFHAKRVPLHHPPVKGRPTFHAKRGPPHLPPAQRLINMTFHVKRDPPHFPPCLGMYDNFPCEARFEAVDRDLHPPLCGSTIPPQPLRPAPQPRPTARPRPSPLQTPSTIDYIRMHEASPLTPPPSLQRGSIRSRASGPSVFLFQSEPLKNHDPFQSIERPTFVFDNAKMIAESIQMTPYSSQNHVDSRLIRQFKSPSKEPAWLRYDISASIDNSRDKLNDEEVNRSYDSYETVQRNHVRPYTRNESRGFSDSFNMTNSSNSTNQMIMESIYGPQTISKMLQNSEELNDNLNRKNNDMQNIEMTPFKSTPDHQEDIDSYIFHSDLSKSHNLQRVSQYIQSLPDLPVYESMNECQTRSNRESILFASTIQEPIVDETKIASESILSPIPPPPAPPDPSQNITKKSNPTTGERIFSALRSVTSQSYIDASEFYNSVLSSAQQVQQFAFPSTSPPTFINDSTEEHLQEAEYLQDMREIYAETDSDLSGLDVSRRSSDLYSPELNLEAHRTAQEVYNSLQDPPSSPLLLKDHNHESYLSDPSFTRTSEDIFNSLEQRRKSIERLNGIHEYVELDATDLSRRRSSQELYVALEEVQLKRRLSQAIIHFLQKHYKSLHKHLEESFLGYAINDHNNARSGNRRSSLGPEPEPPPDESTLKRAISCESVCSDTSVNLNDLEEAPIVGHICVGLEYERWGGRGNDCEGDLAVSVLEARDLIAADGSPAQDTFVRVCLLPDRQTHVQTRIYRGSPSPSYQEKFLFPLDEGPTGKTLLVEVFSDESNINGGASLIGEANLKLGPAARPPATTWLALSGSALPIPHLGELMFSLSYLPTAERLTLVVVKARNLHGANSSSGDFFVKVYLLQQGKKMHKKRTSVKKGEKSPIFNEAIIFNVPAHTLQTIQLRLTVAEINGDQGTNPKTYSVGHIIIGSTSMGKALAHWRQMLMALRRPIAMWHPLRK